MAIPGTRSPNPAIREVARGLVDAKDEQIAQVVKMVDAMPNRGKADQIIAPLRARLARLRPARPLRFARLLFLPLDPLIVPALRWRPGQPAIPRTVITPLADTVFGVLGPVAAKVAAMIEGRTTHDHAMIEEAGAMIWPPAAQVLLDAPLPADWESTGLDPRHHKALSRRTGALLTQAECLQRLMADAAEGLIPPEPGTVQSILVNTMMLEPEVQPMLIALLLARVPETGPVLARVAIALGQRGDAALRHAGEQAAEVLLDQLEAPGGAEAQLGGQDLAEAGAAVRRLTSLLGALDTETMPAGRRERLRSLRERVRAGCESLFAERLSTDLLGPLRECGPGSGPDAEWDLESAARGASGVGDGGAPGWRGQDLRYAAGSGRRHGSGGHGHRRSGPRGRLAPDGNPGRARGGTGAVLPSALTHHLLRSREVRGKGSRMAVVPFV